MHRFASLHIRFPRLWLTQAQEIFLFCSMTFCTLEHFKAGRLNASYSSSLTFFQSFVEMLKQIEMVPAFYFPGRFKTQNSTVKVNFTGNRLHVDGVIIL